jgi:hypothetical protein
MKTMFVWEIGDGLTIYYHSGGGALVIARGLEEARKLLVANGASEKAASESPIYSAPVDEDEDKVFIFPDAGCC